jgi:hypothetical protein
MSSRPHSTLTVADAMRAVCLDQIAQMQAQIHEARRAYHHERVALLCKELAAYRERVSHLLA